MTVKLEFLQTEEQVQASEGMASALKQVVRSWVFYARPNITSKIVKYQDFTMENAAKFKSLMEFYLELPTGGYTVLRWDNAIKQVVLAHGHSITDQNYFNSFFGPWQLETLVMPFPIWVGPKNQ